MSIRDEGITLVKEMELVKVTTEPFFKNTLFHETLILSNVEEGAVSPEDAMSFVQLTMAVCDAHPKDWIIATSDSTYALTPEAFDRAFDPYNEGN
jgi:hypothetical protein